MVQGVGGGLRKGQKRRLSQGDKGPTGNQGFEPRSAGSKGQRTIQGSQGTIGSQGQGDKGPNWKPGVV